MDPPRRGKISRRGRRVQATVTDRRMHRDHMLHIPEPRIPGGSDRRTDHVHQSPTAAHAGGHHDQKTTRPQQPEARSPHAAQSSLPRLLIIWLVCVAVRGRTTTRETLRVS